MKPVVRVVCAIIQKENKTLAVQRSKNMALPLKWEFPGGEIKTNESEIDCIKREIQEELDIEIDVGKRLTPSLHKYPDFTIELIPYISKHQSGILILNEHHQKRWLNREALLNLDWAEADIPIVNEYIKL